MSSVAPTVVVATVPVVTAAASADPIVAIGSAIDNWLTSTTTWLSGLPGSPLTDWAQGALLMMRRTLLNQAPTAAPVQWARVTTGDVVGGINASDLEGDVVTYRVVDAPTYGTVTIDENGIYTYTPGDGYAGTDSFTVAVDNPGLRLNLLDPAGGPTMVTVPVATTVGETFKPGPLMQTSGFNVWNETSRYLVYLGDTQCGSTPVRNCGGYAGNGPQIGTLIAPGASMHFELTYYVFHENYAYPEFATVAGGDPGNVGDATFRTQLYVMPFSGGSRSIESCKVSGAGDCSHDTTSNVYLMDPKNTVITVPASNGVLQAELADTLCATGGNAACSFGPPDGRKLFDRTKDFNFSAWEPYEPISNPFENTSYTEAVKQTTHYSSSITEGSSLEVSAEVGADLLGIVTASVTGSTGQNWESSKGEEITWEFVLSPRTTTTLMASDPMKQVTGDFTARIGNSTVTLQNVTFSVVDNSRKPKFRLDVVPLDAASPA